MGARALRILGDAMEKQKGVEMTALKITASRLREVLRYNAISGVFTSIVNRGNCRAGSELMGTPNRKGYLCISVDGHPYLAHRLAWLYVTGEWPEDQVDHRDTNKKNNKWDNLRIASQTKNQQNIRSARSHNSTGLLGASKNGDQFRARIRVNGAEITIGNFKTAELAHAAYIEAKRRLHEGCTL